MSFLEKIVAIAIFSLLFVNAAFSQTTDTSGAPGLATSFKIRCPALMPSINPLWVIYSRKKIIFKLDSMPKGIVPKIIKSINVLISDGAIKEYGSLATNGVIVIHIDDEKFPNAFKFINVKLIGIDITKLEIDF